jgi:hypothetical protein
VTGTFNEFMVDNPTASWWSLVLFECTYEHKPMDKGVQEFHI